MPAKGRQQPTGLPHANIQAPIPDRRDCQPAADCYNESQMIQTLFGSVEQEPSLLERLKSGVAKTRAGLVSRIEETLSGRKEIDAELLEELEFTLISADIGVQTTAEILERIRQRVDRHLV